MVSTRKKKQSFIRLFSRRDDFDQDVFIVNTAATRKQIFAVENSTFDREFTIDNSGFVPTTSENRVDFRRSESCFNGGTVEEMGNIVDTVEDSIQNATLTASAFI